MCLLSKNQSDFTKRQVTRVWRVREDCAKSNEYSFVGSLFLRSNLRGKFLKSITKTNKQDSKQNIQKQASAFYSKVNKSSPSQQQSTTLFGKFLDFIGMKQSSNTQLPLFTQFYQIKFQEALDKKDFAKALKLIQYAEGKKKATYFHEQITILSNLRLFADCVSFCEQILKEVSGKDDPLMQIQCKIAIAKSLMKLYCFEKARKVIGSVEQDYIYFKEKLDKGIVKAVKDKIFETRTLIESAEVVKSEKRKEEARAYKQLIDNEKTNQDLNEEGKTVFLIPTAWFTKWKEYTGYSQMYESSDAMEEEVSAGYGASKRFEDIFPGAIDTRTLLESFSGQQLLDMQESEFYSNDNLKEGQVENREFLIVTQPVADFFYDIYGGIRLSRKTLENPVTKEINVDLFLKKVTFIPFPSLSPSQSKESLYSLYVSKFATVKELFQKVKRVSQSLTNVNSQTWNCEYFRFFRLPLQQVKEYASFHKNLLDKVKEPLITLDVQPVKILETSYVDVRRERERKSIQFEQS